VPWEIAQIENDTHIARMRFLPNCPDIPSDVIAAQEKGETLFICGAGVSRTVGLPLFRGLVEGIYQELREEWSLHAAEREGMRGSRYDQVLRNLERRFAPRIPTAHRTSPHISSRSADYTQYLDQ
jgi:NAD-dependent SIR2 family protein deacetylase